MRTDCPSCGSDGLKPFFQLSRIPANSSLLLDSREEALAFPRGDLILGFCNACGFITNMAFDVRLTEYSSRSEETQAASPTFRAFEHGLAARLIERYQLRHKAILEIGCGKGQFLALLCRLGENRGHGFDPSFDPDRCSSEDAKRVTFVKELFGPDAPPIPADLVCCKMTLEHVFEVADLLSGLRRWSAEAIGLPVFFQVPDASRILSERAFWDIFYEHCSYFTPVSLRSLFERTGFGVTDLRDEYDGQYLCIEAVAGHRATLGRAEASVEQISTLVRRFQNGVARTIASWRCRLEAAAAARERVVLWGSGSKAVGFLTALGNGNAIEHVVDINPRRHGKFMPGVRPQIVAPEFLRELRPQLVIIMNPIYRGEIARQLDEFGLAPEIAELSGDAATLRSPDPEMATA